jgi:hypothetical protein
MPGFIGAARSPLHGNAHAKARKRAFAQLPEWSACVRCGHPMWKWARDVHNKSALHFDHDDTNQTYLGFAHRACNLKAGARKGAQRANNGNRIRYGEGTPGPGW